MKSIYPNGKNPFEGKKLTNFKQTFVYPNEGSVRFQVQIDKNGQVYDIRRSFAQIIKDNETKKRFVKVTLGDRPQTLYERIKGRPAKFAAVWIDELINNMTVVE